MTAPFASYGLLFCELMNKLNSAVIMSRYDNILHAYRVKFLTHLRESSARNRRDF